MLTLYYHPLASYCWKVLIALYEHGLDFERRVVDLADPAQRAELAELWPLCKFPVLRDGERVVVESSIIIEYLERRREGRDGRDGRDGLVPRDADAALAVRLWDRVFDNYLQTPVQEIVFDRLLDSRADLGRAYQTLLATYDLADEQLAASPWIAGDEFSLADCAAAPALFYAVSLRPFPSHCTRLSDYFERLVERPSVRRTLDEARPHFKNYPFEDAIASRFR